MVCETCTHKHAVPGDCHILCKKPAFVTILIGAVGKDMVGTFDKDGAPNFNTSEERLAYAKEHAKPGTVVRCIWPRSGYYPLLFDPGTVFACGNYER